MLADLEGESTMLGNQRIYSSAWGSPSRGSVELLCTKLVHDLPAEVLSHTLYLPLVMIRNISVVHPSEPWYLWDPLPGHAAKAGFALAPLPPLAAAGLSQLCRRPNCTSAEIADPRCSLPTMAALWAHSCCTPRQCQYNRNEQSERLLLPGKHVVITMASEPWLALSHSCAQTVTVENDCPLSWLFMLT